MKKNKMMRIASILMVATLITTCAISGTFAKYVTKAEGSDSARVAKWGIVLNLNAGEVFAKEYDLSKAHQDEGAAAYTGLAVKAEEKVVDPGTSSEEVGKTITASVKGTPEVATHYEIKIADIKDVVLPKGTYTDYTELVKGDSKYDYTNTFTLDKAYAPVVWDLTIGTVSVKAKSLTEVLDRANEIAGKLAGLGAVSVNAGDDSITIAMDVEPGTEMNLNFELAWAWAFEGNDQADTYLGNIAAGEVEAPDGASTEVSATVSVLAVQID